MGREGQGKKLEFQSARRLKKSGGQSLKWLDIQKTLGLKKIDFKKRKGEKIRKPTHHMQSMNGL